MAPTTVAGTNSALQGVIVVQMDTSTVEGLVTQAVVRSVVSSHTVLNLLLYCAVYYSIVVLYVV